MIMSSSVVEMRKRIYLHGHRAAGRCAATKKRRGGHKRSRACEDSVAPGVEGKREIVLME